MLQEDFNKKVQKGEVEMVEQKEPTIPPELVRILEKTSKEDSLSDYIAIIETFRRVKQFRVVAPTHVPKNFLDAIEFFDDGVDRRVYFYVNKVWSYATLT